MASVQLARALGVVAFVVALLELLLFFRGIPAPLVGILEGVPPFLAVLILYVPGPATGVAAFAAWTNLDLTERRAQRWVVVAAALAMFVPMLPGLLLVLSGLIAGLQGR